MSMLGLVPGYIGPWRPELWRQEWERVRKGDVIIVNPWSGPGHTTDIGWGDVMLIARSLGCHVFGYVPVGRGDPAKRPEQYAGWSINDMIAKYDELYPTLVDGIMLDEWPTEGVFPDLEAAILYARRKTAPGQNNMDATRVVVNPGTVLTPAQFAAYPTVRAAITHEDLFDGTIPQPVAGIPAARQGCLLYGVDDINGVQTALNKAGWGYGWTTQDKGKFGDPWDEDPAT